MEIFNGWLFFQRSGMPRKSLRPCLRSESKRLIVLLARSWTLEPLLHISMVTAPGGYSNEGEKPWQRRRRQESSARPKSSPAPRRLQASSLIMENEQPGRLAPTRSQPFFTFTSSDCRRRPRGRRAQESRVPPFERDQQPSKTGVMSSFARRRRFGEFRRK